MLPRWVLVFLVNVVLLLAAVAGITAQDDQGASPARPAVQAGYESGTSSVWIVVNLFAGNSSKQAVIVRDALVRLGAGKQGIILPYRAITVENMEKLKPAFLALSPNGVPWCRYRGRSGEDLTNFLKALRVIVEEMSIPVVGICGGHQALALAFGGKVGPIRGGEDDCLPYGKNPTERGRHNVYVTAADPIFEGMGKSLNMVQNHFDEVKKLPPDFACLAANELCSYQIMRHPARPAYGVQAHCEYFHRSRPDGGLLLRNFLKIARIHNQTARPTTDRQAPQAPTMSRGPGKMEKVSQ